MEKLMAWMGSIILVASLAACNLPQISLISTRQPSAQVPAQSRTLSNPRSTPTPQLTVSTPAPSAVFTPSPTVYPAPVTASPTPSLDVPCNRAAPGSPLDLSIPDGEVMLPGQAFIKTWRLVNDGSCTWTREYTVVYFSGAQMSAPPSSHLSAEVAPGKSVDISIDMAAPQPAAMYQGNWKLSDASGELFGLGPNGNAPFWVRIVVVAQATETFTPPAPTPTSTATPVVYASGQAVMNPSDGLDLDSNTITGSSDADILYALVDESAHQLAPVNGARLGAPGGTTPPTYRDCTTASLSSDMLVLDGLPASTTFCYRTTLGLPGWARLVAVDGTTQTVTLEILTWAAP